MRILATGLISLAIALAGCRQARYSAEDEFVDLYV